MIVGCYLLGQALEDALNPRLRISHFAFRSWRLRPLVGRGATPSDQRRERHGTAGGLHASLLGVRGLEVFFDLPGR